MSGERRDPEARIIYGLCILISLPWVVAAFVRGQDIGPGTTICMIITALGTVGLVVDWRRRIRLPRACVVAHSAEPAKPRSQTRVPDEADDAVLIVEDEPGIRQFLRTTLTSEGLRVIEAKTLAEAKEQLARVRPLAVLLDLGLPDGDGLELLRGRASSHQTPVLVMSARDRDYDKITALDAGADDFLLKPFDARDLVARVRLAMKRARTSPEQGEEPIRVGPFEIDPIRGSVTMNGDGVKLTTTELSILIALAREPGKVLTHRQLIHAVWGSGTVHDVSELRVHVAALRRKLESDPVRPRWLRTDTGIGYRLHVE